MVVDDPIHVSLELVGRGGNECLIEGVTQQEPGENREDGGKTVSFRGDELNLTCLSANELPCENHEHESNASHIPPCASLL